jgi:hypothetical protein
MPKIQSIQADQDLNKGDKLLGSDISGATRNYVISDVTNFFKNTNAAGIAGQFTYQYKSTAPYSGGSMRVTFSSDLTFQNAVSIKISKFIHNSTESYENILSILSGQQILIVDLEDQDNYGIYGAGTLTQDANETNFFNLDLSTPTKFNGSFTNKKFYAIISIGGGGSDKHAVLSFDATNFATTTDQQGNVTLLEEAINGSTMKYVNWRHDLSKRPSITVAESGSPEQIAHVPIKYIDDNNVRVYFNGTTGGKIYAN